MATAPPALRTLVRRYDRKPLQPVRRGARVRLRGAGDAAGILGSALEVAA